MTEAADMPDMNDLNTSHLWNLACRFARCMFEMAQRHPFASERHHKDRIGRAALRLTARVFEAYDCNEGGLRVLHLEAAGESARELRHYLALADRTTAVSPILLEEAHDLADRLHALLENEAGGGETLARTA